MKTQTGNGLSLGESLRADSHGLDARLDADRAAARARYAGMIDLWERGMATTGMVAVLRAYGLAGR